MNEEILEILVEMSDHITYYSHGELGSARSVAIASNIDPANNTIEILLKGSHSDQRLGFVIKVDVEEFFQALELVDKNSGLDILAGPIPTKRIKTFPIPSPSEWAEENVEVNVVVQLDLAVQHQLIEITGDDSFKKFGYLYCLAYDTTECDCLFDLKALLNHLDIVRKFKK